MLGVTAKGGALVDITSRYRTRLIKCLKFYQPITYGARSGHEAAHLLGVQRLDEQVALEDALGMMGATAVTTQPGEEYGESLRGTPAEFLIGSQHRGVDLRIGAAGRPDPITSPWAEAKIIGADYSETLGNWMAVETASGERYQLGHLDDARGEKMIGQTLGRGEVLGMEGTSGASTGYHLDMRLLEDTEVAKRINRDPSAFYERFLESITTAPSQNNASAPPASVRVEGLDNVNVTVQGLTREAAQQVKYHAEAIKTMVRSPQSHQGLG